MVFYEVGTYCETQCGFQAFFRVLDKADAERVLEFCKGLQDQLPSYKDTEEYIDECARIDQEVSASLGKKIYLSMYNNEMYSLEMREVVIDEVPQVFHST